MTSDQAAQAGAGSPKQAGIRFLKFGKESPFQVELRRRVNEFFVRTGRRKRDCWQMYLKTAIKEHHLFPTICHVNYPAMSRVVEETCREFGVPYKEHPSFSAGIAAHYRWLKKMGQAPAEPQAS